MNHPRACPWCDSEVVVSHDDPEDGSISYYFVECEECGAQGPMRDVHTKKPLTEKNAILAWNQVAP